MHCKLQLNLGLGAVSPKNALFSAKSRVWTHCSGNGGPVIPLITSFRPQLVKTALQLVPVVENCNYNHTLSL